jgi:hypothetical protein
VIREKEKIIFSVIITVMEILIGNSIYSCVENLTLIITNVHLSVLHGATPMNHLLKMEHCPQTGCVDWK